MTSALTEPDALTRLWWPRLEAVGAPPVFRGGFEIDVTTGRLDLQQCLHAGDPLSVSTLPLLKSQLDRFKTCWLEVDRDSEHRDHPSYFFSLRDISDPGVALGALLGSTRTSALARAVPLEQLVYLGWLMGRPGRPLRVVARTPLAELPSQLRDVLKMVAPGQKSARLCYDLDSEGEVGVEFHPGEAELEECLAKLSRLSLLGKTELELIARWPALAPPGAWDWPLPALTDASILPVFRRALSHLKLVWREGAEVRLKLYLYFGLEELKPEELQQTQLRPGATPGSKSSELSEQERDLIQEFLEGQIPDGLRARPDLWRHAFTIRWWMRYLAAVTSPTSSSKGSSGKA